MGSGLCPQCGGTKKVYPDPRPCAVMNCWDCTCAEPCPLCNTDHGVPFQIGTEVRVKAHPGHTWRVFDHHGESWPRGENTNHVVIERWGSCPVHEEFERSNSCPWCANGICVQHHCTWDDIEPA